MIEIIQTARSIIPATHLRKTGISVPPYVFIRDVYTTRFKPLYVKAVMIFFEVVDPQVSRFLILLHLWIVCG